MGMHTWFVTDKTLYYKQEELYEKLDKFDDGEIYLDDLEVQQINDEIDSIDKLIKSDYHDLFRCNKRNEDGTYYDGVLTSYEECEAFINEQNNVSFRHSVFDTPEKEYIYKEHAIKSLKEFWQKYPNGLIYFG